MVLGRVLGSLLKVKLMALESILNIFIVAYTCPAVPTSYYVAIIAQFSISFPFPV